MTCTLTDPDTDTRCLRPLGLRGSLSPFLAPAPPVHRVPLGDRLDDDVASPLQVTRGELRLHVNVVPVLEAVLALEGAGAGEVDPRVLARVEGPGQAERVFDAGENFVSNCLLMLVGLLLVLSAPAIDGLVESINDFLPLSCARLNPLTGQEFLP